MSHTEPQSATIDCLFSTILSFLLPFYLLGASGNAEDARIAIAELIEAYDASTARELDLAGRVIGYNAAAMDDLRQSMRAGLSDRKILQYRNNAVALGRLAEQSRSLLEAMQTRRQQAHAQAPMPQPRPAPVAPPRQSPPPRPMPPAQPQASRHPASAVEDNPAFACDIATMKRNVHAMLCDLQAEAAVLQPDPARPASHSAI